MDRLLALGTVVKVQIKENVILRLMIAGYFPKEKKTGKSYDYAAVPYPYGMGSIPVIRTFNRLQIREVEHQGYLDEKGEIYTRLLPETMEKMKEGLKQALASLENGAQPDMTAPSAAAAPEPVGADTPFG